MPSNQTILKVIAFFSIALLPFDFQPLRYEPFEPHRAGLLALLALTALPFVSLPKPDKHTRWLLWSALAWIVTLILSSIFSLSPAESLGGDVVREMGLWTQLALIGGGLLIGARLDFQQAWRWFWLAGVGVAAYTLLESIGMLVIVEQTSRPGGTLGVATYTGGWLMLALLWAGIGWLSSSNLGSRARVIFGAGLALMLAALLVTGARGALLGLAAGMVMAGFVILRQRGLQRWMIGMAALVMVALGVVFLTRSGNEESMRFRQEMWASALHIVREWPSLPNLQGETDQRPYLRPLVGYGLEMFEPPHRLYIMPALRPYIINQNPDRAHNDALDTLVMTGWLGLLARYALWGSALWLAFKGVFSQKADDVKGEIHFPSLAALSVITAHLAELQFGFTTIATSWPAYLALGLLITANSGLNADKARLVPTTAVSSWQWLAIAGALLIRSFAVMQTHPAGVILLLAVMSLATYLSAPFRVTRWLWIGVGWLAVFSIGQLTQPEGAALFDVVLLVGGLGLLIFTQVKGWQMWTHTSASLQVGFWAVTFALALFFWGREITADIYLGSGFYLPSMDERADLLNSAAQLRPWDADLLIEAGDAALQASMDADTPDAGRLAQAQGLMERAVQLNGYDAGHLARLGILRANLSLVSNYPAYSAAADQAFAASAALYPGEVSLWRAWAQFALQVQHDPQRAQALIQEALRVEPENFEAQTLAAEIEGALR
jgi:hypothetical protein